MRLTTKEFYEVENKLNERTLFQDKDLHTVTQEDWDIAVQIIKADFLSIVGPEEYNDLHRMIEEFCFSVLDSNSPKEMALATCRRLSKSTKYVILALIMIIRIPWYNAAFTVKYQNRIAISLLPAFESSLGIMKNSSWIQDDEYVYLMSKITQSKFTFGGRKIVFASSENPSATLGIQATTDVKGFEGIFVHQIDDELIIEEIDAKDKIVINDDEQMTKLDSISESLKRDKKAPFGMSFQRIRLFNTWDFTHKYFVENIEGIIPASDRYKNKDKHKESMTNRLYLMDENEVTDGVIIKDFYDDGGRLTRVGRMSFKATPDKRFDIEDFNHKKKTDYNRWLPIYGAVPGKQINVDFTYPIDVQKMHTESDVDWTKVTDIMIGLDRGKRDKTALVVILKYLNDEKWYVLGGIELSEMENKLRFSKTVIHNYLKAILLPIRGMINNTLVVNCDYHAYDFAESINELVENDIETGSILLGGIQQDLYYVDMAGMDNFYNKIGNRVDYFNNMFLEKKIVPINKKFTDIPQEMTGVEVLEIFESVKDNPRTGQRDERRGQNNLDTPNAFEYAVINDIRY